MKENNNNTIYKYSQLYDILLEKILANEWKANDKMPTERELSIRYNVSRVTVRDTLNRLAQAGYIYRIQGKGTFVSVRKIEKNCILSGNVLKKKALCMKLRHFNLK